MSDDDERSTSLALQLSEAFITWTQRQHEPVAETVITEGLAEGMAGILFGMVRLHPSADQEAWLRDWLTRVRSLVLEREP